MQFGGSGREDWSQDQDKMPQTRIQASFWHFVDRNRQVWGHLEYASIFHNIFLWECEITRRSKIAMQSYIASAIAQGSKLSKEAKKKDVR